ncbi:MAG: DUF5668 domain-containing protein [Firmicutes bacterium]|nr:DUF5668 domain-containing protein [Bacillota bacterium]
MHNHGENRHEEAVGMLTGGLIVLGVGVFFLLMNFGLVPPVEKTWPVFPIIVGLGLLVGSFTRFRGGDNDKEE